MTMYGQWAHYIEEVGLNTIAGKYTLSENYSHFCLYNWLAVKFK